MKHLRIMLYPATLLLFVSCAQDEHDTVTQQAALIFDQRNTYQSSTLTINNLGLNIDTRIPSQLATLSTGTAYLKADKIIKFQNGTCILTEETADGSAQLTSPTRLATAHHNISNAANSKFVIHFDGTNEDSNEGKWIWDQDGNDGTEENPLLANRLWQLGLDYWAENTKTHRTTTRAKLRQWKATLDLEGVDKNNQSIASQPFIDSNNRRDIAFLKATELSSQIDFNQGTETKNTKEGFLTTGLFQINQPGMFFNQVEASSWTENVHKSTVQDLTNQVEKKTPLQLLSAPAWLDQTGSLSSWHNALGTLRGATNNPAPAAQNCSEFHICSAAAQPPVLANYQNCIRTSLDSIPGSSGGAMLMSWPYYSEADSKYLRYLNARRAYGVVNGNTAEGTDNWSNVAQTAQGVPQGHFTSITVGDQDYERWGKRTTTHANDQNLFEPVPLQPATDGLPTCEVFSQDQPCAYSIPQSNDAWEQPEQGAPLTSFERDEDADKETEIETETRRYTCNYNFYYGDKLMNHKFRHKAGMVVGLIGTSTHTYYNEEAAVASLGIICAPWSSQSWSDNWNWLLKFLRVRTEGGDARQNSVWQPVLRLALPFMIEQRQERESEPAYLRPMSMKMCPPNYMLKGVRLLHSEKTLRGISHLLCENMAGDKHEAPMRPESSGWNYLIKNKLFSLEQRIGDTIRPQGDSKELSCPEGQIVGGIQLTKPSPSEVKHFWLECMPKPAAP